jgi:hypothetical protein
MNAQQPADTMCYVHEIKEVPRYGIPGTIWQKNFCPYCKLERKDAELAELRERLVMLETANQLNKETATKQCDGLRKLSDARLTWAMVHGEETCSCCDALDQAIREFTATPETIAAMQSGIETCDDCGMSGDLIDFNGRKIHEVCP